MRAALTYVRSWLRFLPALDQLMVIRIFTGPSQTTKLMTKIYFFLLPLLFIYLCTPPNELIFNASKHVLTCVRTSTRTLSGSSIVHKVLYSTIVVVARAYVSVWIVEKTGKSISYRLRQIITGLYSCMRNTTTTVWVTESPN